MLRELFPRFLGLALCLVASMTGLLPPIGGDHAPAPSQASPAVAAIESASTPASLSCDAAPSAPGVATPVSWAAPPSPPHSPSACDDPAPSEPSPSAHSSAFSR